VGVDAQICTNIGTCFTLACLPNHHGLSTHTSILGHNNDHHNSRCIVFLRLLIVLYYALGDKKDNSDYRY